MTQSLESPRPEGTLESEAVSTRPVSPAEMAQQRAHVYHLLAVIFGKEPTKALLMRLGESEIQRAMAACGIQYRDGLWKRPLDERLMELEVEYARLFLGPGTHLALQESVRRGEGQLWGTYTEDVVAWYGRCGYGMDQAFKDLPDHLAVELQFLGFLADDEYKYWQTEKRSDAIRVARWQLEFVRGHPLAWVPKLVEEIESQTHWAFYRGFARLLDRTLTGSVQHLQDLISSAITIS